MKKATPLVLAALALSIGALAAAPPSPPSGKRWQRVNALSDEFNGNGIDTNKWFDYHPYWTGRPPSRFKRGNAFVAGGHLQLRSTSRIDNMGQVNRPFEDIWVDAAAVVSKQKIAQPGWYYECRMKASDTAMSSSFWFRVGQFSEIDVIEHIGHATNANVEDRTSHEYGANTHLYGPQVGPPPEGAKWRMPRKGRAGFETYGFWWKNPTTLIFYYNDREVMRITPRAPFTEKLNMIFDTETLASRFVGLPTIASLKNNNRNVMRVDWVRAYRLVDAPPSGGLPSPGQRIAIRDLNGNYLSSSNGASSMISNRTRIGSWEVFTVVDAGGGKVALRGNNGQYVSSENAGSPMNCNRPAIGAWEKFDFVSAGGNRIALRGNTGEYMSSENSLLPVNCNRSSIQAWERFTYSVR